ncbi:hypothetical protein HD842_004287 [Massilia aurea]|uniref:Lipoprotein n=1 Tax=Massilia aurea TaxID=373040 RepID=A0A7W9X405_9BURK|nr:hypothetical protein [Massilia aurea]MBB6136110.1 hypothetical protein [Massilia aurea]
MQKIVTTIVSLCGLALLAACTTVAPNTIREVNDNEVARCRLAGPVQGADAVFVGLSAAIGSKNARAKAMNQAVRLQATDVVWSQQGTSMTSEWVGKAYVCK